jgi:hypothetical protein
MSIKKGWGIILDNGYLNNLDNLDNEFSNKYENNLKNKKILLICSTTYKLMMNQISCNFIII